jgi:hypothetical protein
MKCSNLVEFYGGMACADLVFIAKAVCDDETRPFMNCVLVEDLEIDEKNITRLVSCDPVRLHILDFKKEEAERFGIIPGKYRVLKAKQDHVQFLRYDTDLEVNGKFPDYKKVIPEGPADFHAKFESFDKGGIYHNSVNLIKFFRSFPQPTAISFSYLKDLGDGVAWDVEYRNGDDKFQHKAIVFKSGNRTAVIMPMVID